MNIDRIRTGRLIAAVMAAGAAMAFGASSVSAGQPENPELTISTAPTCFDEESQTGGSVGLTVTNPLNGGPAMNVTVDVPGVGSFGNALLADGDSQVGGFNGLAPGVYVATATTTAGGSAVVTFVIDPCPPPTTTTTTTTTTSTSTTTSTTVPATTTDPATTTAPTTTPPTTAPPATSPPSTTPGTGTLPATGADSAPTALLATSLLALGGALVLAVGVGRSRRA